MRPSWTPRRYVPADDSKIDGLLRRCYPHYRGSDYWSWVLKNGPLGFHGTEGDIWVAEAGVGTLIGYYGRVRVPMWLHGKSVVGSQVAILATHPDYRRQGVFEKLASSASEDAKKNGIGVTFGFPNRFSYPGSVKHGWADFGRLNDLTCVLQPEHFLKRGYRNPITVVFASILLSFAAPRTHGGRDPDDFEVIPGFLDDVGMVWDSLKPEVDLGIERTKPYLEWRYHPRWGEYRVLSAVRGAQTVGYVVVRTVSTGEETRGYICELASKNDDLRVYQGLLRDVLRRSREERISFLSASASCSRGYRAALRGTRFRSLTSMMHWVRRGADGHAVALCLAQGTRVRPGQTRWYHSIGDRDFG